MTYHHSFNPPITYGDEWDHFVDDEARARGIPSNDQQALEDLEEELEAKAQDYFDQAQYEANEQFDL